MPRRTYQMSDEDELLEDRTAKLQLRSKRTERQQKRQTARKLKSDSVINITKLPTEIILQFLELLPPGDVLSFSHAHDRFRALVYANQYTIGNHIIQQRYSLLVQCFPLPKMFMTIDPSMISLLRSDRTQGRWTARGSYQHVQSPGPFLICPCLSCFIVWNNLCVALDFAYWQDNLDTGIPLPLVPRGQSPDWNQKLLKAHADLVLRALKSPLWHARILEIHLVSTVRAIKRHATNKGNRKEHVQMTDEEAASGTDEFLAKPGPLSMEFPFQRDEYYLLYVLGPGLIPSLRACSEAYLPNRIWKRDQQKWYFCTSHHKMDLETLKRWLTV